MLVSFFKSFNLFTTEEVEEIVSLFEYQSIKKGTYFIREGEYCTSIALIEVGIFRSFYTHDDERELTYCFRFSNDLIGAYSAFITGNASIENIQAIVDTKVWSIPKVSLDNLAIELPQWNTFLKILAEQQYLELENRVISFQRETAHERYKNLLIHQPVYVQQIPLQYLSSYLGITQRHLSRIRKEISF
ncbi:Crp/Fnr family transcriptional regulator [Myroides pelagicus]|uniref:Cyclic nucleotide-binding domain-containing protein n=1 Tax=Myroides pelagicus TaxID=270914 RepID=A0A7K1GN37_9FLAO|nr:Crp/Fnr family transcriptional regulator [Myroides pelagicus]MEC4114416.1 Crp/Fnr family transcriptional regulator [Myroides pelagicus]MTH30140.1 cyclic nucleotide-binding domain-containing protein [Myroides pelagicus]